MSELQQPITERGLLALFRTHTERLQRRLAEAGVDVMLVTNVDSIYYLTGYWGDLGMEFGRPTIVMVPKDGAPTLITALMEMPMCQAMTWVEDLRGYTDGDRGEWRDPLAAVLGSSPGARIGLEWFDVPAVVADFLRTGPHAARLSDATEIIARLRMIKGAQEIAMIRQAGQVAIAMGAAGKAAIGEGVPEYEVSLACIAAGTRKAAEIIAAEDLGALMSPMIHNLQVLQSGHFTSYVHLHPRVRPIERGDPVYMCFCPIAHFKQFKLGYDREYFVGEVTDETARTYQVCVAAQQAAIAAMRPGAIAEDVNAAAVEVYRAGGFEPSYRTGRALGYSSLEQPELKQGDTTPLEAGMLFAVDGGITVPGVFGARVGDSVLVTETGTEVITESPRDLEVL